MGLLDPAVFENLNKLKGLLGETPIGRYVQGMDGGVSMNGLLGAMRGMPVFDQQASMGDMRSAMDAIGPSAIAGTTKLVKGMTKFEKAHKLAQKNAALPIEQGGLGLPKNNTAADRAKALGFDKEVLHGTNRAVSEFDPEMAGAKTGNPNAGLGVFTTPNAQEASRYAEAWGKDGGNVMPLVVRSGNSYQMPYKEFDDLAMAPYRAMMADPHYNPNSVVKFGDMAGQKAAAERVRGYEQAAREEVARHRARLLADGYDTAIVSKGKPTEEVIALQPSALRSRFAAFDPARVNEPNLLAAYFGVPLYGNGERR